MESYYYEVILCIFKFKIVLLFWVYYLNEFFYFFFVRLELFQVEVLKVFFFIIFLEEYLKKDIRDSFYSFLTVFDYISCVYQREYIFDNNFYGFYNGYIVEDIQIFCC